MEVKSLYRGGFVLLLGFLLVRLGGFVFKIICMNVLTVEAYGEVAIFLILFNWFVLFATFNVTIGLSKFVAEGKGRDELYYASALAGSLVLSMVVSALLALLSPIISAALNLGQAVVIWAVACVPFAVVYNIAIFYLRGRFRMKSSVLADSIMTAVRIAALVGLLYAGFHHAPYMAFMLSFVLIDVYLLARGGERQSRRGFGIGEMRSAFMALLAYSAPVFLGEFLRTFSLGIDRIMLSGFFTTAEAGIYDVAVLLCIGYVLIANSYSNALLPLASGSQGDRKRRRSELGRALKASSLLFVGYSALLLIAGQPVISMVNPAYMEIFGFLPVLALSYVLIGFLIILTFYANGIGFQRHTVYAGAVFAFLSLVLNSYLVPSLMYWGAIYALLASSAASLAVMAFLIFKVEK
ncbi:MAG: oligosaccharide flippase family protein [Candidatus Aenigmarchaeota archaeon]|nr:oligosaccharide flippase family protein [Candidatus Aenigmarchaeota archaeon]